MNFSLAAIQRQASGLSTTVRGPTNWEVYATRIAMLGAASHNPTCRDPLRLALTMALAVAALSHAQEKPVMPMEIPASAHFQFHGPIGERVRANVDNWLLHAPIANPGMIEMFRRRDRTPVPELVPWAWGINGCGSVLSAVLATLLAIHYGFTAVMVGALVLYVVAATVFARPPRGPVR